jgi:hypothetical protein
MRINKMRVSRAPKEFVGGTADFTNLAVSLELIRGRSKDDTSVLLSMVPEPLRQVPCFIDRLSEVWLYDFGEAMKTTQGSAIGVGITFHPVIMLLDVVRCAHDRLALSEFTNYLTRLADPKKHADMLFEFAPILRLAPSTTVKHEVTGESPENRTIDWRIDGKNGLSLLLEVKRRATDLIQSLERIEVDESAAALIPSHDPGLLFRSVEAKFLSRSPDDMLQGVWIGSALKQEDTELEASFKHMDQTKLHFAILGSYDGPVHLISRKDVPWDDILQLLAVQEGGDLVFQRPAISQ